MDIDHILAKYRDLIVDNVDRHMLVLTQDLRAQSQERQMATFAQHPDAGGFYLYANREKLPGVVFECVRGFGGDSISSCYKAHPIFNSAGTLIAARAELIAALAFKVGLPAESVGIDDAARGRALGLHELATGQLIDLLAEKASRVLVQTDTHAIDGKQHAVNPVLGNAEVVEGKLEDAHVLVMQADGQARPVALRDLEASGQ
jgi:hypothetical protein